MKHTEGEIFIGNADTCIIIIGKENRDYIGSVQIQQTGGGAIAGAMEGRRLANAEHLIKCWNEHPTLQAKADLFDEAIEALEAAQTAIYDALHAGNLSRSYSGCVSEKVEKVLAKAKGIK